MVVKGVLADQMPPQSGIISVASEPIAVKTTPTSGPVMNRKALVGQSIYLNDEINTSPTSKAQILLKDQTVFNIGPNSMIVIDKFVYDPQKSELNVSVKKGAFKFFSGKIANSSEEAMKVSLPNATIAVRGTGVAGSVEPNGSATVILLHGAVDIISTANNSTSSLTKSGWAVQINPAGIVSAPVKLPADVSRNIIQTSKSNQNSTQTATSSSSAPAQSNVNPPASASAQSSQATQSNAVSSTPVTATASSSANTATPLASEVVAIPTTANSIASTSTPITSSTIQSSIGSGPSTVINTSIALAGASSTSYSTAEATNNLGLGNAQLTPANSYLSSSQSQASSAITQASNATAQSNLASTYATTAANQATIAANAVTGSAPELAIRANELAAAAATSASSASTLASNYSTQTSTSATSASQNASSSSQTATTAIGYANTATTQANLVLNGSGASQDSKTTAASIVSQASAIITQANAVITSASNVNTNAANAAISAQSALNQASVSALAAANSALNAYASAQTVAQTLTEYETISQTIATPTILGPLGNVTFSTSNYAMSCWSNCNGASATINNHTFVFNFLTSKVTNNYNISFNNFNGYTGTVSGANSATPIFWSSPTVVSLPVTGQISTVGSNVYAMMDVVLTSVGISGLTNRANLATVYTSLFSGGNSGVGATSQMGVGSGYKILGK